MSDGDKDVVDTICGDAIEVFSPANARLIKEPNVNDKLVQSTGENASTQNENADQDFSS